MSALPRLTKQFLESLLGSAPVVEMGLRRLRGARLVLSYHNVIAQDDLLPRGDRSLHLPLQRFRAQLDAIARWQLDVVPLDAPSDASAPPRVVITFDDAYAGALDFALPELERRGWPSTVFVAPGLLGSAAPWWDRLASPRTGAIPDRVRDAALESFGGEEARILLAAESQGWTLHPPLPAHRIATEPELAAAAGRHSRLRLAAHTWSHPNVSRIAGDALLRELVAPRDWLRERFGAQYVDWLAYPYGRESAEARATAASIGYRGALRVAGGWDRGTSHLHARPRLNVTPGISDAGFRARLAGLR